MQPRNLHLTRGFSIYTAIDTKVKQVYSTSFNSLGRLVNSAFQSENSSTCEICNFVLISVRACQKHGFIPFDIDFRCIDISTFALKSVLTKENAYALHIGKATC